MSSLEFFTRDSRNEMRTFEQQLVTKSEVTFMIVLHYSITNNHKIKSFIMQGCIDFVKQNIFSIVNQTLTKIKHCLKVFKSMTDMINRIKYKLMMKYIY